MIDDFFNAKRPWSQYKDLILGYYLEPYIPKVNTIGKPILVVDCFAGPGQFKDGKPGSPLIISSAIQKWRAKGVDIRGIFIEENKQHFESLEKLLQPYADFAKPRHGRFENHLPEFAALATQNTVFMYVDPYTVKALLFEPMRRVYQQIQIAGASVEVLINFNAATFMRWGLAAMKRLRRLDVIDVPMDEDNEPYGQDDPTESIEIATLNEIAGGEYWQSIALDIAVPFAAKLEQLMQGYAKLMTGPFRWVCWYGVKAKYHHTVPKYYLVYATRSDYGIELMNDAMCKARREFVKDEFPQNGALFDMTPASETIDMTKLCGDLMQLVPSNEVFTRRKLRIKALSQYFGRYSTSDYTKAVAELLKGHKLFSRSGKSRINDQEPLSTTPFATA